MSSNIGDFIFMKKIYILLGITLLNLGLIGYATCPISGINAPGMCTGGATRNDFTNSSLQDRMIPNRMDNIKRPNSDFSNNRTLQGQQNTPQQINRELSQQESTQPYDANCQFGNCINKTNTPFNNRN